MEKYTMTITNEECEVLDTVVYRVYMEDEGDKLEEDVQNGTYGFESILTEEEVYRNQEDSEMIEAIARDLRDKKERAKREENDG